MLGVIIGFAIFKNKRRDLQTMLAVAAGDLQFKLGKVGLDGIAE